MSFAGGQYPTVPRSFSYASRSSENDDLSELIRAVTARRFADRIDVDAILRKQCTSNSIRVSKVMPLPKSRSVGMDRIVEEEFEGDDNPMKKKKKKNVEGHNPNANGVLASFYPRSRSCVVGYQKN